VPIQDDHFNLFGLPARFALDERALDEAYKRVQAQVHPDRFAAATAADRRAAMQWAVRANEAVKTLRSPLRRAAYLCELNGVPIDAESNTAMPAPFLTQQMTWREELDEVRAGTDRARLQKLLNEVDALRTSTLRQLEAALDGSRDFRTAAGLVRQFMFIEKFGHELEAVSEITVGAGAG
jgi:molecular chaperone HscB